MIDDALAKWPLFGATDASERRVFAAMARTRTLKRGERLFEEGDPCEAFYFVASGRIRVFRRTPDGRVRVIHHVEAGQSFAEAAAFGAGRYPASAEAAEPSALVAMATAPFLQRLREKPELSQRMIGALSMWLRALLDRIEELTLGTAAGRLAHYLVRQPAKGAGPRVTIRLPLSKRDIAARLGIAPETLSRVLHDWETRKLVTLRSKEVEVLDLPRLETIAESG